MKNRKIMAVKKGGPKTLHLVEEEKPQATEKSACVRILAAGISFADILMREGVYNGMPDFPFTPGYDIVGMVESVGEGVSMVKPGDYVAALSFTGGYAEYIILREEELVSVPSGIDPPEAVSLVLNYVTAYQMIHRSADLHAGNSILVHGAAGGVGTALLQLGKLLGLRMVGTASKAKHETVRRLGAIPVDYNNSNALKQLRSLEPGGYDAIFDGTGQWGFPSYRLLRTDGQLIIFGIISMLKEGRKSLAGTIKTYLRASVFLKNLLPGKKRVSLYSITKMKKDHPEFFRTDLQALFQFLQEGKINPVIALKSPLEEAAYCHDLLNRGKVTGKMVLVNSFSRQEVGENQG